MYKVLLLAFAATLLLPATVFAEGWHGRGDIHNFHGRDFDHWRGGRWEHGFHEGRDGWWWNVGGLWYSYPAPVYPYPDPYTPPVVVAGAVIPGAPQAVYYCPNPAGYYPYIPQCYTGWQRVAAAAQPVAVPQPVLQAAPQLSAPMASPATQRQLDDRQLNAIGAQFAGINLHDKHARVALKNLEKQTELFRQSLYRRSYNAMDLLKDAEDLQHRIAETRAHIARPRKTVVAAPPVPQPGPAPILVPPPQ